MNPVTQRRHRIPRRAVACLMFACLALPLGTASASTSPEAGSGTKAVIVQGRQTTALAAEAVRRAGGTVTAWLPIVNGVAAEVPENRLSALEADATIFAVTPNSPVTVSSTTTEGNTTKNVFAREVNADRVAARGIDGSGVTVALIDTGVAPIVDLASRLVAVPHPLNKGDTAACANFSGEDTCNDSYGHGTFMAGLIAGTGAASGGTYRGVAPGAKIASIKIAGRDGSADVSKVLAALQYVVSFRNAVQPPIKVVNLSLGTNSRVSWRIDPMNYAVQKAWTSGLAVVVSASNRGPAPGTISKPADDPLVITAGAVDDRETPAIDDDRLPRFSGRGPAFLGTADEHAKPDVVAPGAKVISLRSPGSYIEEMAPGGFANVNYRRGSGTSMSAAIVSGVSALVLQANPTWKPDRLKFALMATARKVAERDVYGVGSGLVNAEAAAFSAPAGLANGAVQGSSDGSGSLDGSRGDVIVSRECRVFEPLINPMCDRLRGEETGQGEEWDAGDFTENDWTGSSWYESQWALPGSSWYGSSWYGCSSPSPEISSCWYGSSWYGSSWYGSTDETFYGASIPGSSWYGSWS